MTQPRPPAPSRSAARPARGTRGLARVFDALRADTFGGTIIVAAAALGLIAANSPAADLYGAVRDAHLGIPALGIDLSIGHWASDGLLAIFFFTIGLELKRELVVGALSRFSTAIVPVAAAVGGVAMPALIYAAVTFGSAAQQGWAIPTATDIAFAVAVLGVIAPGVPPALRLFLLTLAVVDDLIAILIIATVYTRQLSLLPIALALVVLVLCAWIAHRFAAPLTRIAWLAWVTLLPMGALVWALVLVSGVHATIAGVLFACCIPVRSGGGAGQSLAKALEHRIKPLSAGFAVPVFAFFAAGVSLGGTARFFEDPIAWGVLLGLVLGKPLGIAVTTWGVTRCTRAQLDPNMRWRELWGVAALAGVGFTVSLLITELSLHDPQSADTARLAVMVGSLVSVGVATVLLRGKRRATRAG